jgi:S1-C subfamily serine protease
MQVRHLLLGLFIILSGCTDIPVAYSPRDTVYPIVLSVTSTQDPSLKKDIGAGTAVVIAPGYALTAYHILRRSEELDIFSSIMTPQLDLIINGERVMVLPVKIDKHTDLALVQGKFECPCASLYKHPVARDTKVIAVSYPLYDTYKTQILTDGRFQGTNEHHFITTAQAAAGSSGGGIFIQTPDSKYHLVSIIKGIGISPGETQAVQHHWIVFSTLPVAITDLIKGTDAEKLIRY